MNSAIGAVYAITIGGSPYPYTDEERRKLVDCIPALVDQAKRLEELLRDPFIRGYIERFGVGKHEFALRPTVQHGDEHG
jgi:hypothetical protein